MVTDALLSVVAGIVHTLLGTLPQIPVPDWLSAISDGASLISGYANGLGVWVPIPLILAVASALIAAWLIGFGIKVARIVASFLTLGGGSAA